MLCHEMAATVFEIAAVDTFQFINRAKCIETQKIKPVPSYKQNEHLCCLFLSLCVCVGVRACGGNYNAKQSVTTRGRKTENIRIMQYTLKWKMITAPK